MNEDVERMLKSSDKGVGEASGVLSRLWRQILADRNMNPYTWGQLMQSYLDDPRNGIPRDIRDKSSVRGNLNKELKRPRMTWKVFMKGLRFLSPRWVRFEIHFGWDDGTESVHHLDMGSKGPQLQARSVASIYAEATAPQLTLPAPEKVNTEELERMMGTDPQVDDDLHLLLANPDSVDYVPEDVQ
jgi:hypothetical protein